MISFKRFMEMDEALSIQQRMAKSRSIRRNKAKIALGRKKAARKIASPDKLWQRARRAARKQFEKKLTKGISRADLSLSRRSSIEARLDKMAPKIDKVARKLLPKIRKAELAKKRGGGGGDD